MGTGLPVVCLATAPFANTTAIAIPTGAPVVIVVPEALAVETPVVSQVS